MVAHPLEIALRYGSSHCGRGHHHQEVEDHPAEVEDDRAEAHSSQLCSAQTSHKCCIVADRKASVTSPVLRLPAPWGSTQLGKRLSSCWVKGLRDHATGHGWQTAQGYDIPVSTRLIIGSKRMDPRAGTARPMMSLSYWAKLLSGGCCWEPSLGNISEEAAACGLKISLRLATLPGC